MSSPSRILVNLLSPIGDTLFATQAIAALHHHYPQAYLAAVVYPTNYGILEATPDLDEIFVHPTLSPARWGQTTLKPLAALAGQWLSARGPVWMTSRPARLGGRPSAGRAARGR